MRTFTCAVFGADNAGKTSFIQRVCGNGLSNDLSNDSSTCILNRHDTTETGAHVLMPIQIDFIEMHGTPYITPEFGTDFAIIAVDVSRSDALTGLADLCQSVARYAEEVLIVAMKIDIKHANVNYADIQKLRYNSCVEWISISAHTGEQVYTPLHILLDYALD